MAPMVSSPLPSGNKQSVPPSSDVMSKSREERNNLKRKKNKEKQQRKKLRRARSKGSSRRNSLQQLSSQSESTTSLSVETNGLASRSQAASLRASGSSISCSSNNSCTSSSPHPFPTVALDHCETPQLAYEHLNEFLRIYLRENTKDRTPTRIWDPYYCDGSMKRIFEDLGFPSDMILHENKDFYKLIATPDTIPHHSMLVTNPPYSDDHIDRLLEFCITREVSHEVPCCVLLPNWVSRRPTYSSTVVKPALAAQYEIFYLTSAQPYTYTMPSWVSSNDRPGHVLDDGHTTPYLSSWYIFVPPSPAASRRSYLERMDALSKEISASWVVAKTAKGLKWKIDKKKPSKTSKKRHHL